MAGGRITAAKVGPAVAAPEAEWRKSGVGGKKRKRNVLTNAKEESRVARKRRQDSVGRKRPIDKVSEQVVPRDNRRRGHYCLSNCGRVPLGPRERAGQYKRKEREGTQEILLSGPAISSLR